MTKYNYNKFTFKRVTNNALYVNIIALFGVINVNNLYAQETTNANGTYPEANITILKPAAIEEKPAKVEEKTKPSIIVNEDKKVEEDPIDYKTTDSLPEKKRKIKVTNINTSSNSNFKKNNKPNTQSTNNQAIVPNNSLHPDSASLNNLITQNATNKYATNGNNKFTIDSKDKNKNKSNSNYNSNLVSTNANPTIIKPLAAATAATVIIGKTIANTNTNTNTNNNVNNSELSKNTSIISQYGKIISSKKIDEQLNAWIIEKNGKRVLLYTTANNNIILSGIAWDTKSKQNINTQFNTFLNHSINNNSNVKPNANTNASSSVSNTVDNSNALAAMTAVSSLEGIKEGNASYLNTLYIIFDPRCPHCRTAYNASRKYIAAGKSIKWIPALVLGGNQKDGEMRAAALLQASNKEEQNNAMAKILGEKQSSNIKPTTKTRQILQKNADYFFTATKNSNIEPAGVPIGFFWDKNSQKARVMMGLSEDEILKDIFNAL